VRHSLPFFVSEEENHCFIITDILRKPNWFTLGLIIKIQLNECEQSCLLPKSMVDKFSTITALADSFSKKYLKKNTKILFILLSARWQGSDAHRDTVMTGGSRPQAVIEIR
jgi:hypothetical protein